MRGTGRELIVRVGGTVLVDLGNDPPLSVSGAGPSPSVLIHSPVSWRWLTGTVLTGFTSIALMGVALVAALNNPRDFASLPQAATTIALAVPDGIVFGQKGDRIRPIQQPVASRQVLQVSTVTRQGERDLIKLRPFAKISTTLIGPTDQVAKQIPAFDMLHIMGDGADAAANLPPTALDDQFYGAKVDGEVSVKVSDFPVATADLDPSTAFSALEVEQIVRAASQAKGASSGPAVAYPEAGPARPDPAALAVRIETENVSSVAKTGTGSDATGGIAEKVVGITQAGDLGALMQSNGVPAAEAAKVVAAMAPLADVAHLKSGQKVRLAFLSDGSSQAPRLVRTSLYQDGAHQATVARTDNDSFVRADEPATPLAAVVANAPGDPKPGAGAPVLPRIYDAVYATALAQQMPKALVDQLIRILAFDVDLQAHITPGDAMDVFHSLPQAGDTDTTDPEILYAALTLGGVTKRFYRYRTADDGAVDYYDEQGQSAKKFLLRKPVVDGEITSGFGYRVHPILGERILHTGIDYAAERNTPIFAAGDGIIEQAGPNAGYGNFILIKHTNGYETAYGHMTRFAKDITEGVRVRQGQIIGYVGSTGLSTGPHVHFEIRINDTPVDPLRVRLPQGRTLNGDVLTAFETERARIDALLGVTPPPTSVAAAKPTTLASAK